jgi:hypothetical protein
VTDWLARHPRLFIFFALVLCGVLGYFGLLRGRMSDRPLPSGIEGVLFGVGGVVFGVVFAYLRAARRRRG